MNRDLEFMGAALREANVALEKGEAPVGAVVVHNGRIIGRGHNLRETLADPTAHAEMIAITAAATARGDWRLENCTLYVSLEPCIMCAGAIVLARIPTVVFAAPDPKAGACGSVFSVLSDTRLNHQAIVRTGVLRDESAKLLIDFFSAQRAMGKK